MVQHDLPLTVAQAAFHDYFQQLDQGRWAISDGWANNLPFNNCWRADHVRHTPGMLTLTLDDRACAACADKPYVSGELQSTRFYHYGRFEAHFKAARGAGLMAGSLFTYTGPEQGTPHHEIDIEILGKDTTMLQTNYYTDGVGGHETLIELGFDAAEEFHTYAFEWAPDAIRWYVNGRLVHVESGARGALPSLPAKLMLNLWPGVGVDDWLGPFSYPGSPVEAHYAWVRFVPGSSGQRDNFDVP